MSGKQTCTLSEALSEIAFGTPTSAKKLPRVVHRREWVGAHKVAWARLHSALQSVCDGGYCRTVAIWGRTASFPATGTAQTGRLRLLTRAECEAYRLFVPGHDNLWDGSALGVEFADSFRAYAMRTGIADVRVDRTDLSKLIAALSTGDRIDADSDGVIVPFTNLEIDSWIKTTHHTGMKKARDAFMKHPRAKGLSATFERRWNDIKQNPVGRPKSR